MPATYHSPHQVLELGIFAKTFRATSVHDLFSTIAGHRFTCTQWNWTCMPGLSSLPEHVPNDVTQSIADAAARFGVRICAVSATFNILESTAFQTGLSRLPALAHAARAVGCDLLTLCTGTRHPTDMWSYHPDNASPEAWKEMLERLRELSRLAKECGTRVAIEPETANVVCDAAAAERALQELGPEARNVSIILDAANLYRPPLDPRVHCSIVDDAVVRLGQHISLAHAKDIADPFKTSASDVAMGHYTHVAAGTGILPYVPYLAALTRTPAAIAAAANGSRLPLILHGLQHEQVPTAVTFLLELLRAPCPA